MKGWLDKYQEGGEVFLQPNSKKLPKGYKVPLKNESSELAMSIGGEQGEPAYLIPSFKYGKPLLNPLEEYRETGEHLGGPFKTWQEADKWEREIRHPYVEKGQPIPSPLKYWGEGFKNGGVVAQGGETISSSREIPEITVYGKKNYLQELDKQQQKYLADMAKYKQDSTQWVKANQAYQDSLALYKDTEGIRYNSDKFKGHTFISAEEAEKAKKEDRFMFYDLNPHLDPAYEYDSRELGELRDKIKPIGYIGADIRKDPIYGPAGARFYASLPIYKKPTIPTPPAKPTGTNVEYDPTYENLQMRPLWATMAKQDTTAKIGTLNPLDPLYEKGFTYGEAQKFPEEIRKQHKLDYPIYEDGGTIPKAQKGIILPQQLQQINNIYPPEQTYLSSTPYRTPEAENALRRERQYQNVGRSLHDIGTGLLTWGTMFSPPSQKQLQAGREGWGERLPMIGEQAATAAMYNMVPQLAMGAISGVKNIPVAYRNLVEAARVNDFTSLNPWAKKLDPSMGYAPVSLNKAQRMMESGLIYRGTKPGEAVHYIPIVNKEGRTTQYVPRFEKQIYKRRKIGDNDIVTVTFSNGRQIKVPASDVKAGKFKKYNRVKFSIGDNTFTKIDDKTTIPTVKYSGKSSPDMKFKIGDVPDYSMFGITDDFILQADPSKMALVKGPYKSVKSLIKGNAGYPFTPDVSKTLKPGDWGIPLRSITSGEYSTLGAGNKLLMKDPIWGYREVVDPDKLAAPSRKLSDFILNKIDKPVQKISRKAEDISKLSIDVIKNYYKARSGPLPRVLAGDNWDKIDDETFEKLSKLRKIMSVVETSNTLDVKKLNNLISNSSLSVDELIPIYKHARQNGMNFLNIINSNKLNLAKNQTTLFTPTNRFAIDLSNDPNFRRIYDNRIGKIIEKKSIPFIDTNNIPVNDLIGSLFRSSTPNTNNAIFDAIKIIDAAPSNTVFRASGSLSPESFAAGVNKALEKFKGSGYQFYRGPITSINTLDDFSKLGVNPEHIATYMNQYLRRVNIGGKQFPAATIDDAGNLVVPQFILKKLREGGTIPKAQEGTALERPYIAKQDATKVLLPLTKKVNQEEIEYYNPPIEKGITSGDKRLDFLYNNQWLFDVPIVNDYIRKNAKELASISALGMVDDVEEFKELAKKNDLSYSGHGPGKGLISQYFDQDAFPPSKYKPTSDYLTFLPSYSLKSDFESNFTKAQRDNYVSSFIKEGLTSKNDVTATEIPYNEFIENKKPVYNRYPNANLVSLGNPDLGGHKMGAAWDYTVDLPYVSISDAWDFEPVHYTKAWAAYESEPERQKRRIQSTLLHKAGHPFKIYDRFYFDPKTKEYISDDSIQTLKREKGITPLEDEFLNKDISKYFTDEQSLKKFAKGGNVSYTPEYIEQLKQFENRHDNLAYHLDNKKIPTIGWGHRITEEELKRKAIKMGKEWIPYEKFSGKEGRQYADRLMELDVAHHYNRLERQVGKDTLAILPPELHDVLLDITYNRGSLGDSLEYVKKGDIPGLKNYLADVSKGLKGGAKTRMEWRANRIPLTTPAPVQVPLYDTPQNNYVPKVLQNIVQDNEGYRNPENYGKPVQIVSNQSTTPISMQGVPFPILAMSDTGELKIMMPGEEHEFEGGSVTEVPMKTQNGVTLPSEDFMNIWTTSPMHSKMLERSSPKDYNNIQKGRLENLANTSVQRFKEIPSDIIDYGGDRLADSNPDTGVIRIFDQDLDRQKGLITHEKSHSSDRPLRDFKWKMQNFRYNSGIDKELVRDRLIPQSDIDLISKFKPKNFRELPNYIEDKRSWENAMGPMTQENEAGQFMIKSVDYYTDPTEVRARLNDLREKAYINKIYNPLKEKVSSEQFRKLISDPKIRQGTNPLMNLQNIFSDDEIMIMLNLISENQSNGSSITELPMAQEGDIIKSKQLRTFTEDNGWLNKYKEQ